MSPKQDVRRYSPAVTQGVLLPSNKYPWLKDLVNEVDFVCSTCSSAEGSPVYHTFWEAHKEPLGGPGKYTTSYSVYCPTCRTVPTDSDFIHNGLVDLMTVPRGYKRPPRPNNAAGQDVSFEDAEDDDTAVIDAAPVKVAPEPKKAKVATAAAKAKKARLKAKKAKAKLGAPKA